MIDWVCVRIAVIKKRLRMLILRANVSSILAVLISPRLGCGLRNNGWCSKHGRF
jgi:hypothetical protein